MLTTLLPIVLVVSYLVTGIDLSWGEVEGVRSAVVINQLILQDQIVILQEMERTMKNIEQSLKDFSCPYPFVQVLDECFYLSDMKLTVSKARNYCQGMKGDLASPKNIYALKSYVMKNVNDDNIWVGGTDEGREGVWKWFDGRPVDNRDFSVGQPNNYEESENCLEIITSWHPTLNDDHCNHEQLFVCQYTPSS